MFIMELLKQQQGEKMPNHCLSNIELTGSQTILMHLAHGLEKETFCQLIKPMPLEYNLGTKWYKWRCDNWGTKWEIYNINNIEVSWDQDKILCPDDKAVATLSFQCDSAWSPIIPVLEKLMEFDIRVSAYFCDECGNFEFEWEDGVEIEIQRDEVEE